MENNEPKDKTAQEAMSAPDLDPKSEPKTSQSLYRLFVQFQLVRSVNHLLTAIHHTTNLCLTNSTRLKKTRTPSFPTKWSFSPEITATPFIALPVQEGTQKYGPYFITAKGRVQGRRHFRRHPIHMEADSIWSQSKDSIYNAR